MGMALLLSGVTASEAFTGDCLLDVDGQTYLDGPCNIEMDRDGSFSIGAAESTRSEYFAFVDLDPDTKGVAAARWNGVGATSHADESLGNLFRHQGCWINDRAKVCAWRSGTRPRAQGSADAIGRQRGEELTYMAGIEGRCTKLQINKLDASDRCKGVVLNTTFKSGRSGFYFVTEGGEALTFSGDGGAQVKKSEDDVVQPVDRVILSLNSRTKDYRAVGACSFSNPYKGTATLHCKAETGAEQFEADFISNGSPPKPITP